MTAFDRKTFTATIATLLDNTLLPAISNADLLRETTAKLGNAQLPPAEEITRSIAQRLVVKVFALRAFLNVSSANTNDNNIDRLSRLNEQTVHETNVHQLRNMLTVCHEILTRDDPPAVETSAA
jgi:hypothetical protein